MHKLKTYIVIVVLIALCQESHAQIRHGKIVYERKTNLYKKLKSDDAKDWLKESDKIKIDVFELYFNDSITLFKQQESDLREYYAWATIKNMVYQNNNTGERLTIKKIWNEEFVLKDSLVRRDWKITDSKRNICGYNCRKAIWQANDSTRIYAWYCTEIELSIGPENFIGLPGAILGLATEDGGVIYFAKSVDQTNPSPENLQLKKTKAKVYKTNELKAKLEKEFGKDRWGKEMIENNFGLW
ncbi:MAG: GLPGLI family protein [Bacteroidetes bacterium]|nr:GLPGLI family protein [Bacteroidota bacterium]